jgi:anti-sigma factor RsiW
MSTSSEHHLDWNDRLQDWLDRDVEAAEGALVERHLAGCTICQQRLAEFEQLDAALHEAAPRIALDDAFDRRIFAQIEAVDEASRAQARERAEQELQQNLHALSRGWRRALGFVVPGAIAGVAIAFALATWLDDSTVARQVIANAPNALGHNGPTLLQWFMTALLGATLGLIVARWLARLVE